MTQMTQMHVAVGGSNHRHMRCGVVARCDPCTVVPWVRPLDMLVCDTVSSLTQIDQTRPLCLPYRYVLAAPSLPMRCTGTSKQVRDCQQAEQLALTQIASTVDVSTASPAHHAVPGTPAAHACVGLTWPGTVGMPSYRSSSTAGCTPLQKCART